MIVDWTIRGSSKTAEVKLMDGRVRKDRPVDFTIASRSNIGLSSSIKDIRNGGSGEITIRHVASENNGSVSPLPLVGARNEEGVPCHGARWIEADVNLPINDAVPQKFW